MSQCFVSNCNYSFFSVYSGAELVLDQSILELGIDGSGRDYLLRVKGLNEYLDSDIPLANYVYVQQCIKLDQDVQLIVVKRVSILKESWARTVRKLSVSNSYGVSPWRNYSGLGHSWL